MKAYKRILLILLLIIALGLCYFAGYRSFEYVHTPRGHFTMDEKLDLAHADPNPEVYDSPIGFKDEKLYYFYGGPSGSIQPSGIYEISENGVKYFDDADYHSGYDYVNNIKPKPMEDYDDEEEDDEDDKLLKDIKDDFYKLPVEDEEENPASLYNLNDKTVIYLSKDLYIKEVDLKTHKCLFKQKLNDKVINLKDSSDYEFEKYGYTILLIDWLSDNYVIYNVTDNFSKVFSERNTYIDYHSCNYYKGDLFIASETSGVYRVNLKTNKVQKLCGNKAVYLYIFGDKWVYFNDRDDNLYRTAQDGSKTETLFDKGW
ncbi:MAG: hypothetical protein IJ932_01470 [Ruminococcus sp.]|nr:hypothetical protein [Ruminococcus sp.]